MRFSLSPPRPGRGALFAAGRRWFGAAAVAVVGAVGAVSAVAQPAAPAVVPPVSVTAVPEPRAEDTQAERALSQPGNNAPFWRAVRESGSTPGVTSLPGAEKGVLIQPLVQYPGSRITTAGEAWRQVRNRWIIPYGGAVIFLAMLTMALHYFIKGPMGGHVPNTGRRIERFTALERATHWTVAASFVALAISGIVLAFGKYLLLPVLGLTLFGWLTYGLKTLHNFAGPLFAVALVVMAVIFLRDNLWRAHDLRWLAKGGGILSGEHVPAGRYNAGEKIVYWGGVIVLGFAVVGSGLVLNGLVPGWGVTRGEMQVAHIVHGIASMLMMAMFVGHIYLGTLGTKDALVAMRTGYVDEGWAKEHHELWYDDVKAGRVPAVRTPGARPSLAAAPVARR